MEKISLDEHGWVLVADGEKALFLRNEGDAMFPNLRVFSDLEQKNPQTHEQGTDRPGGFNDGPSVHRSGVQETDWHRIGKERFARDLAERLYKSAHRGAFDQLVIIAPPVVLGELRKEIHSEVASRVVAEYDKDLTNHPVHEIEKMLLGS
jgi:protein required for attachment to host cells